MSVSTRTVTFCDPFCWLATTAATLLLHSTGYLSHLNIFIMVICSDEAASIQCAVRHHKSKKYPLLHYHYIIKLSHLITCNFLHLF